MKRLSPERQAILDMLSDGCAHTPASIATKLGKSPATVNKLLLKLTDQGHVYQPSYGAYAIPKADTTAPAASPKGDPGVYILKNGPYYKIGKSANVPWRVQQLQVALPQETLHIHTIPTDTPDALERELHARYADKHVRGEWYALDMFDIDDLCHMGEEPLV